VGPVADKGVRLVARILDAMAEFVVIVFVWISVGDANRPLTNLFLAFLVVTAYEAVFTVALEATPAKRILGLRIAELDTASRPGWPAALRRGATIGVLSALPIVGWAIGIVVTFTDPLGRGPADRVATTMVVPRRFGGTVLTRDLPGYADARRAPRLTPWGRVADLDVRFRARLRRIAGSPTLVASIGILALAASLPVDTAWVILATSAAWLVVFTIHETWLVHRTGTTPGHDAAGLVIVDRRTGNPPRRWRSFLRAATLALTFYLPLLWPVLVFSLLGMRFGDAGRGLHDVLGGTVVVGDRSLDPESQRQRAMRMRMGRAD
jgi:uncharacterized RDD family membrane protein YckC